MWLRLFQSNRKTNDAQFASYNIHPCISQVMRDPNELMRFIRKLPHDHHLVPPQEELSQDDPEDELEQPASFDHQDEEYQ